MLRKDGKDTKDTKLNNEIQLKKLSEVSSKNTYDSNINKNEIEINIEELINNTADNKV